MGRKSVPAASIHARYYPGPPKRIMVGVRVPGEATKFVPLSTLEARFTAASLLEAIDTAEADKIALRGDATQKAKRPKRDGTRGMTKKRPVRSIPRSKRIELAAINLESVFRDLLGGEGAPLELIPNDDLSAGLILSALTELTQALGSKASIVTGKPNGGLSL